MNDGARGRIREVLGEFGVAAARRATTTDPAEEVLLLKATALASVDIRALTLAVMDVLPHTKVWVVEDMPLWASEPL